MKQLLTIALLTICLSTHASWKCVDNNGRQASAVFTTIYLGQPTLASYGLPGHPGCPAFLTTVDTPTLLGNLTGKTLTATAGASGSCDYTYCYPGGTRPPNTRFFICKSNKPFKLSQSQNNPDDYWWSNPVSIDIALVWGTTGTITVNMDPSQWSNPNGNLASDPLHTPGFLACVANVGQAGLGFGAGSFFDTGYKLVSGSGTFHLFTFTAQ